ncbi:hypothetical protein MtrunA17_Chr7g0244581 [Medicago truncatula]|uniref:Transmembrane protein n=1 Tax=Medicago truncatula TaxID=3880 RepID=A0A396GZV8_MEDTR|nr:hypothetical protein MtrunA17_Chr7g0244581 [Medicago truncatula]
MSSDNESYSFNLSSCLVSTIELLSTSIMMSFVGRRTRSVLISGSGSSSDSAELSSGESNGEDDEVFGVENLCCLVVKCCRFYCLFG